VKPRRRWEKAVVLLSGGLDSAVCLAWALNRYFQVHTLSVRYGQRHVKELKAAARLSRRLGAESHRVVSVDLRSLAPSALTHRNRALTRGRSAAMIRRSVETGGVPTTYVPARNSVFLALAASAAEGLGAVRVVIGANVLDYSGYVDCRPRFLRSMEKTLALGTALGVSGRGFKIEAPLIRLNKAQIIGLGLRLGVDFGLTWSCYLGKRYPCGGCDSCILRRKGFEEAGLSDPLWARSRLR